MPNPLDTLYDQLKGQYPDLVDRSEFIGKLSNEDELKKLHDAASKDIPGFVDFDNFKSKVGESLSTYDQDSDYKAQSAPAEQESAPTDITIPRREKGRHVPSEPQNGGISSEAYVPTEPGQPIDTRVDTEAFDRETGDLDELDRRYQEKVKRLEGYGREPNLYANEDEARKHYEAYSRLLDEAEQDRLVYNRRVKAADDERAEQQRQLDLQSKDRKTRRSAEYGGYTNDQVRKEQERLKKERAYLEDPKSRRNADYSKRVMEYKADQTALSGEADKRNKRAESKRAMYDEVRKVAEDPDVQKRITGNDTVTYVLSGNNPYALQNYDAARERAKTMSDEELVEHCKTIAGQKYARGDNKDIYAPPAAAFMAYHNELMYRLGGDEPKSALEMRYDMIDKATESSPEGDNFMLTLRNYLDGTAGMGTANFENDQSERANIPQFAVVDNYNALVAQKEDENMTKVEQIARYPQQEGVTDENMAAAANDISYDKLLEQAFERFGNENLKAYITAYALRNGISIDEAARRVNQSIWDETIGKTLEGYRPKSGFEFFVRRIFSDNMFAKLGQLGLRARNGTLGTTDPFAMSSMALDEYAKDHPILETGAAVFNFAVMEGPIFSGYGKVASGLVGATERAIIGAATKTADKMAIDATARALGQSLMYRLAKGGATGALTGFQYGTMSGAIDQAYYDGNVDFGKVIANGGHMARDFAIMHGVGELFGVTGDAILRRGQRNLRNGQGVLRNRLETTSLHFLNNVAKTTANASIVTGLYAAIDKPALERENKKIEAENKKIEAENARLPEDKQKPLKPLNQIASVEDTFYSSLRMFAGLDAVGALRRAWSIGVRGDYDRNKHVKVHFDKFDRETLEKAFGKNPNSLLRQIVFGNVDGVPAKWFEIDPEAEAEIYKELGRELTPAEKEAYATYGFTELRKVILNKDIPWATRAKIVSVVTGRIVQEPPVARGTIEFVMDKSGTVAKRIIVKSLDMEGNVIQAREFDGQREFEAARSLYESLNDRGWRNNALLCGNLVIDAIEDKTYADTVDEMAREKGIAPDQFEQMVFGIKQKDITGEKVTYQERQLVDEFDKRHQEKQKAETELSGPSKLFEQIAREVFGAEWKRALNLPRKSWGEMSEAEKEFVNKYIDRIGAMGVAERNKLMNANPDWARAAKEYEESVRRRMAEAERPAEAEPLPALEDEKVSVETPVEERVEPTPEVIELEEEPGKEQPTQSAGPQDTPTPVEERPAEPSAEEKPATVEPEQPMTEEKPQQAGTIGFEPVEQPTERERYDAERKAKAATITDADIEANREALGIPEGTALTDETRQIYAEDLAEDLMRYERFKRGESDEKARFHDYWENKFNPKRPKLEKPAEKQEEPVEEEELEEEEVTDADALIEQFDNLKGRSDLEKYRNALKVFAGDDEIMAILEDLEPRDITEWVSSFLGLDSGKGYSMLWESKTRGGTVIAKGFKEETGWSWNDVKGFAFMFDNKNGMSPRRVAEKIWEALPSGMKNQYSDVDVFNIMMDLFKSSSRKSDLTNYIRNNRMEQVRELLNRRRSDELADIARYKERMSRGEEEPVTEPVTTDESDNEFAVREDEVAPFSLLSLNYRQGEVEGGTIRSRARTRKQIGTIAKALGYKIRWVADKPYNAKIDTDEKVLYLNIRTDQPLAAVMGHEVTHDLRKSDPKAYETLKRYAQDLLGQEQWDSEVADVTETYNKEYERRGWQPIRADKAEEEVVCDTMGKVLHTKKGLRELAGSLDTTVAGKVYRLMKDITDKVKTALGKEHDYSPMDSALQEFLESVEQRAKNGIHRDPSGGYSVTDKADIESMAPRMDGESEAAYSERIGEIEADEKAFVDGDGQFSLKREDTMRDNSVKYFEEYHVRGNKDRKYGPLRRNSITRQALDKANEMIAEMRDYIAPWYDRETGGNRYLPEEVYGLSTIFDNASYGATLENTLICTRTLAYNDFCDNVKRKLGRPLTKRESFLASQMLYDIATDPQCLYCYVSLDRKAYDEYLLRYFDERDAVIERYNKMADKSAENIDALYKTFLDGRKDTYQMRSRFNSWLQLADHDSAIGRDKVALSSDRKNALAQESDEEAAVRWRDITKQYNRLRGEEKKQFKQSKEYLDALHAYLATEQGQIKDACAYAQGASWAKKEAEYRSYTGELLRTTKRMLGGLASHYGLRFYSFSEYSPAFILENMQMVRDAALRGLKGFAYTKEIDFCKIFLPTGININCSTYGRRNAAGEIVMDERQGANWDEARALRDQYENMGIVFVATDDEMVRWAKEQPWIDVIIPFHIVRTGADIAEFYGWTNYTNVSADYDAQGRHKDIMPPEHNNSIEEYDRLIAERGLTRRFPQFYDGPGDQNYMKLINETRRKASDTPILTPVFNMEEAKKSFDKFVEKGGYWGGFYEVGADDVVRAVDEVAADIEAGKSAGEVEYGRQDIDFDSAMANLEKTRRRINRNREHGNTPKTSFSLKREDRNAPTFYSNAAKAVENVKQNKATAEQWKAMLTKAGGIKAGEDKWMGLSTWLDEHKGQTLTKDEVAQFVADNGIQMEETYYGEKTGPIELFDSPNSTNEMLVDGHPEYKVTIDGWSHECTITKNGDVIGTVAVETSSDADKVRNIIAADLGVTMPDKDIRLIDQTRLNYTTNGLENKREIAFVVPDVEPYQEHDEVHFGPENQGRAVMWVRFGETRDADGNRVLVIDEIQSNRHQDAREKGYKVDENTAYTEYKKAIADYKDAERRGDTAAMRDAEKRYELYGAISGQLPGSRESYQGILKGAIPAAPFEKNWHEVAMKRMLRLAAEEGFDKVAWTTGEQQAERYNIGNAVRSIDWRDNKEMKGKRGKLVIIRSKNGTFDLNFLVDKDGRIIEYYQQYGTYGADFVDKNLSEVVGKEIADKIMSNDGVVREVNIASLHYKSYELRGDGLRIGGEGMKSFYDKMLPQFMNKYGKRWGVKTGTVELDLPNEGDWVMHSVDVTPEMKESVMQGQPLFSLKRDKGNLDERQEREVKTKNFKNWFGDWENDPENASKVVDADGKPLVVYRGGEKINIFEPDKASRMAMYGPAFYATPSYVDAQEFGKGRTGNADDVQAVYLDIRNPWVDGPCESLGYPKEATMEQARELVDLLTSKGLVDGGIILAKWNDGRVRSLLGALADAEYEGVERGRGEWWHASAIVQDALKELGYDGVVGRFDIGDGHMVEQVAAFEPTQIKSATENNGDFSRENPDIRFSLKREKDTQKVFDTAKRKFGETKDIREAGYVLPDGSMLDFSGRHELDPGTDSSFLAGRRTTDHRAINQISFVYDENGDEVDTGVSSDMPDFIKRGAIRIDNNAGSINLSVAPTMAQRRVLRELIRRNGGDVQVDFGDGWNSDHYVEYEEASAQRVLGDIDRYFDEGIKPEGNMRFSLKRETRTDADGNEVYTETREDGTKDREITTYSDGSKKALWYDDKGNLKERLDYFPDGEVSQVANYDNSGNMTRHIQYDENRRITSYWLPAIGTDWRIDENGVISGKSNGVEIKPYNFQFSLKTYHGSGADFDRFNHDYVGSGEGNQAYGWGTYVTEVEGIGRRYAMIDYRRDGSRNHFLYSVEIPDEKEGKYLPYGERVSDPQVRKVLTDRLQQMADEYWNGEIPSYKLTELDKALNTFMPREIASVLECSDKEVSQLLSKAGYTGVKYVANVFNRGQKGLSYNYVIFNEKDLGITDKEQFSLKRRDVEYEKAVADGDEDTARAMVMEAAKSAMPDTKIKDKNGNPVVLYHGTFLAKTRHSEYGYESIDDEPFYVFETNSISQLGAHFGTRRQAENRAYSIGLDASNDHITGEEYLYSVYLDIHNPIELTDRGKFDFEHIGRDLLEDGYITEEEYDRIASDIVPDRAMKELLKSKGYDGAVYFNEYEGFGISVIAFEPNQIKSAEPATYDDNGKLIPLSQRFNPEKEDIRFSLKRRRNRDDYTDEDRADAAIIANTYLAQADALRQQIEADRQREHRLVEERNRLLAFDYPAADPADRPAIMDRINDLRNQINDLRNANYENNTKLRSMDYEYRVAKEILEQGAVTDEEAARFDAGQMTREEKVLESLFKAAADSRADKKAKQKAIRGLVRELTAITDNFKAAMKARGIESQRKHYDKGTVDHIIRLAKAMMGTGYIDNMTSYEVKRLMGMINNAATRESIEEQAGRIVDMMLDHQIRTLRNDFNKQLKVTGQKTNSSGVQVQAGLDQEGQVVMEAMRKSMQIIADSAGERYDSNGYLTEWGEFYEKTLNDMGDADPVKAEQASKIFEGVWLASKWYEDVRTMEINGRILRSQMEDFKASNKPAKDADKDTKQRYNDVLADYQEMLRQNKIKIIEAYERMTGDVGLTQAESVRRAKEFADAQKQRVNEIQHNANSDLADVDDNTQVETPESRVFGANKNNVLARLLFASAGTYEKFMRFFGRMAPNGEGYLFKRFMTQYHHARQDYWKGRHSAFEEMDKKMAEVFGKKKMHWSDIYEMTRDHKKFPPITVSYWDGYRNGQPYLRVDELNQSEALYLYMINKMPDGRMKLRHMGITDDVVQQMAGQIDGRLIQLADWLQSEFLPKMRIKYNETHKRVFGADMAAIEDYFPLRINKLAVASDMDITERDMNDNKPSTITGAIVKRRVNTLPIDLHTDAFDVALSHIDEMEHWSAFAEFNRDNNTLVNYKRFRTKVNNMRSLELGAGNVLWKNFTDAVAIAADAYHPRAGSRSGDHYSTRVAKFVSTAKIALRPYTALKQLLSIPAFWADSDPLEQMKATVNVANTWQWAIENLPGFAERWQSRQAGNIKLANYNDLSGLRRRKAMRKLQRAGMWANAAIDGLACAMGGKAVYETKLKRYRKMGYDETRAQEKALIDAAVAYNNSQQSSEGAYVSPLQVDRTWFANAFSVFRSASMGYTRRFNTSLRQLRNATFKPGYGAQSVEFLKKQMMRDGLTKEQAEKWAHRIYRRANLKAAASVAIFGQILPFTWNLGANMFYLLFGDDNKEKEGILADSFRHSFFGPVEGLTGGNVISELGDIASDTAIGNIWGDSVWGDSEAYKTLGYREFSTMPLSSDLSSLLKYFARDEVKAANEVVNILFQVATGVNPQTITDWATAILDFSRSDMERRDIAMFAMRLLSTPQSQLDKFYLDQMNISQEQADKMSVDDLIKRYATYKRWRETPLTGWMYSDEHEKKVEEKFQKRYEEMLEERSVAEDGLRGAINDIKDLPRKRTMMQKLQKELTDSIEAADPELYKKALEGEKADDDEYVRHVTDKDVEQMAELQMKKKALRAARDRKVQADKDAEAGRITQEEYDAIYEVCAHEWKLYNYLNNTLPKKLKEWKLKMEPDMQDKYTPEQVMDTIRSKTDKALQMRPEDMKLKKGDKKKVKKNKKK